MKIYWTEFAISELNSIFNYFKLKAGVRVARNIVEKIAMAPNVLIEQPFIGQVEEFIDSNNIEFRYLITTNYKVIYWINEERGIIEIMDVFDVRQNPVKMNRVNY